VALAKKGLPHGFIHGDGRRKLASRAVFHSSLSCRMDKSRRGVQTLTTAHKPILWGTLGMKCHQAARGTESVLGWLKTKAEKNEKEMENVKRPSAHKYISAAQRGFRRQPWESTCSPAY
jgi:hypothetical protein